jgi:hypothetical protein
MRAIAVKDRKPVTKAEPDDSQKKFIPEKIRKT